MWNPFWFPLEDFKERGGTLIVYQEGYEPALVLVETKKRKLRLGNPVLLQPVTK